MLERAWHGRGNLREGGGRAGGGRGRRASATSDVGDAHKSIAATSLSVFWMRLMAEQYGLAGRRARRTHRARTGRLRQPAATSLSSAPERIRRSLTERASRRRPQSSLRHPARQTDHRIQLSPSQRSATPMMSEFSRSPPAPRRPSTTRTAWRRKRAKSARQSVPCPRERGRHPPIAGAVERVGEFK